MAECPLDFSRTGAMSTDWCKYSTPEETRSRARKPDRNQIGRLSVNAVRQILEQEVEHTPIQNHPTLADNRAHTDVRGPKIEADLDVQDQYSRICALYVSEAAT